MAMGPATPEEIEALFVKNTIIQFIKDYVKETEEQQLEKFDEQPLPWQKAELAGEHSYQPINYGYKHSSPLQAASSGLLRLTGLRTNNNARKDTKFIDARRKYVEADKIKKLEFDPVFQQYLNYKEGNPGIPEGGRVRFLTYLGRLPETMAGNNAMKILSDSDKYTSDETLTFEDSILGIFTSAEVLRSHQNFLRGAREVSGGRRRNKVTRKVRRNKRKTRRN